MPFAYISKKQILTNKKPDKTIRQHCTQEKLCDTKVAIEYELIVNSGLSD